MQYLLISTLLDTNPRGIELLKISKWNEFEVVKTKMVQDFSYGLCFQFWLIDFWGTQVTPFGIIPSHYFQSNIT